MNILKELDQLVMGKTKTAEYINFCLHEKDYDLRHSTFSPASLEIHKKKLQAMKNILSLSDNIVSYMNLNQDDCEWEEADSEIYDYVFNLRNLMIRYQQDFGKKDEWLFEAA